MLTPNSPIGRMEYVIKTYWGKFVGNGYNKLSLNCVVLDTFEIAISLVGAEGSVIVPNQIVNHEFGSLQDVGFRTSEQNIERIQNLLDVERHKRFTATSDLRRVATERLAVAEKAVKVLARIGQPYEYDKQGLIHWDSEQWGLAELALHVSWLPDHSPADFLIPWVGRELSKLAKASVDAMERSSPSSWREFQKDYSDACELLKSKAPAIAQWAKETRTDVGKINLATALETIATHKFKTSPVEQGAVVYTFSDGWTVQELRTERALDQEGTNMQNCVGGYCEDVERGDVRIYSIRDVGGNPHVTMELTYPKGSAAVRDKALSPEKFLASGARLDWYFAQILGKQNDRPSEEYRERAREFIDKAFDKEGIGWCVTGGDPGQGRFAGRRLNKINFNAILEVNGVGADVVFAKANFYKANLTDAEMRGLDLRETSFAEASVSEVDFHGSNLRGAKFDGAQCVFTKFVDSDLAHASFDGARCGGADFKRAFIGGTTFRGARVDGASFVDVKWLSGTRPDLFDADLTDVQRKQLGAR